MDEQHYLIKKDELDALISHRRELIWGIRDSEKHSVKMFLEEKMSPQELREHIDFWEERLKDHYILLNDLKLKRKDLMEEYKKSIQTHSK